MSLIHDRDLDAAAPQRALDLDLDLDRGQAPEGRAHDDAEGLPGPARGTMTGRPVDAWRAITNRGVAAVTRPCTAPSHGAGGCRERGRGGPARRPNRRPRDTARRSRAPSRRRLRLVRQGGRQ